MNFIIFQSHGMLIEEVLPHIELFICKLRNGNSKLDNQMSRMPLLVDKSSVPNKMFRIFSRNLLFSVDCDEISIKMLDLMDETK